MDYQTSHVLSRIGLVLAGICMILSKIATGMAEMVLLWIGLALVLLNLLQAIIWYRCPKCRRSLMFLSSMPKSCPKCGTKLGITADSGDEEDDK